MNKQQIAINAINERLKEIEAQKPTDELLKEFSVLITAKMHYEFKDDLKDFIGIGPNANTQQRAQLMETTSNLVKSHHNLSRAIDGKNEMLVEARRICKAVRVKLLDECYLDNSPTIKRIDRFISQFKKK